MDRVLNYEAFSLSEEGEITMIHKKGTISVSDNGTGFGRTLGEAVKEIQDEFGFELEMEKWQDIEQGNEVEVEEFESSKADVISIKVLKTVES